jgi:gp16 family phage-associated protein
MSRLRTAEEAKAEITRNGVTVAKWAIANGISPSVVYAVLKGGLQGHYGEAHRAAVLLGMKDGVINANQNEQKRA